MKRTVIYKRVSTDKQELASQEKDLQKWSNMNQNTHIIVDILEEKASGMSKNRPKFNHMMNLVRSKEIDCIVVWKSDRFGRNSSNAIRCILDIYEAGADFVSVTEAVFQIPNNPFKYTMASSLFEAAQLEREKISERVKAGLSAARERGVRLGAPPTITDEVLRQVVELRKTGKKLRYIASKTGVSLSQVQRICATC